MMSPTEQQIEQVARARFNYFALKYNGIPSDEEWSMSRDYYVQKAEEALWFVEAYLGLSTDPEPEPQPEQPSE